MIGDSYYSDMAIDDVNMYQGECPPINVDGSLCDFEASSNCQLEFDLTSDYFWKVQRGPTTNQATGPSVDHTLGTAVGQFVFILLAGFKAVVKPLF